jgi:hypothetical protein
MRKLSVVNKEAQTKNYMRYMLSMMGYAGRKLFRSGSRMMQPVATLYSIDRITPGGSHAWCESDRGMIRKPLSSIPKSIRDAFSGEV